MGDKKRIAVFVRDRPEEALRIAGGITLRDDIIDVYVLDKKLDKASPAIASGLELVVDLNDIPFLEATDFMLIAGRPGEGKSSVLRAEAFEAALAGRRVVIFNMENDPIEYANYLVAYHSGIDTRKLRKPDELTEEEVARVKDAARELKRLTSSNLKIVSLGSPTVYEITRIARKLVTCEGYEVVFVDYIQLIKNGIENEVQDLTMSSSMQRGFALKYNVPVIAAAQLNRDQTKRAVGTRPQLSDLRGSGSLEH